VVAEPDTTQDFPAIGKWSFIFFTHTKFWLYRLFSAVIAIPVSMFWGFVFAFITVFYVWFCAPALRLFEFAVFCFRRVSYAILYKKKKKKTEMTDPLKDEVSCRTNVFNSSWSVWCASHNPEWTNLSLINSKTCSMSQNTFYLILISFMCNIALLKHPMYLWRYSRSIDLSLINSSYLEYIPEHFPFHSDQFGVHHCHPEQPHVHLEVLQVH
jgi:hypothetical protein